MKRVLFISHHLNRAGTEAFMMNVFRGIDQSKFRVDFLLYTDKKTDYTEEVERSGSMVWRVPSRRDTVVGWYASLNKFFKHHAKEYVAVHYCGSGLTAIYPLVLAYKYGIPIRIAHAHSSSSAGLHNRILHVLQRNVVRRLTTHHFACSTSAAHWFFGHYPARIIRNGISTQAFAYNPEIRRQVRGQLNISDGTTVIGHVGRFQKEKNHAFILDVFAEYLKLRSTSLLMLIGTGDLLKDIKSKAKQLGVEDKVLFLGERSDVGQLMQAMDLFLMPSTFEGQPFVLIEAQCAGLPCLVSDVVNTDICLTQNVCMLSLMQSACVWAQKIVEMLNIHRRKDESKTIEQQEYSVESTIKYLEKVYNAEETV